MRSGRGPLRLSAVRPDGRLFAGILGVGLLSALSTVQVTVTDAAGVYRDILCVQEERVVGNDNTVRYRG